MVLVLLLRYYSHLCSYSTRCSFSMPLLMLFLVHKGFFPLCLCLLTHPTRLSPDVAFSVFYLTNHPGRVNHSVLMHVPWFCLFKYWMIISHLWVPLTCYRKGVCGEGLQYPGSPSFWQCLTFSKYSIHVCGFKIAHWKCIKFKTWKTP